MARSKGNWRYLSAALNWAMLPKTPAQPPAERRGGWAAEPLDRGMGDLVSPIYGIIIAVGRRAILDHARAHY
jgi:hypothetical protein